MRFTNLVLFALCSVSLAFAQTAGTGSASDALAFVSKANNELQSGPASDITPKLTSLTAQLQALGSPLPVDQDTKSKIAVQGASIVKYVANQGMNVGPDALGGDMQSALKAFLEAMGLCVPGVDKEISRVLDVVAQVFLKNNAGNAMAVLSKAEQGNVHVAVGGIDLSLGLPIGIDL
ncbi:unnamed protein product [Rhizoctonia solani]|uniref:Uncharacterized protein n=1 Tax=Rhizoctonia solani TaxID=456999 RepID=A0A8H3GTG1_9AGAM|nr:unnamed protein product [Rhizoctonia solani]